MLKNYNFNWLKVFRLKEVLPGVAPLLLAALDTGKFLDLPRLVTMAMAFISIYVSAFLINELVDSFDTDQHNPERSKAITKHGVSRRFTLTAFIFSSVVGILLFALLRQIWIGLIGFLILFTYSAPIIRIKSLPFLELVAVTVGCCLLPYVSYHLLTDQMLTWKSILTMLFFSAGFPAIQLINEGADYAADKKANITTTSVFLGEKNNLILVSILSLASAVLGILTITLTGHWWYFYIVGAVFFLFTAAQFGLTIYKDKDRLHELLRTGERFGVFISDVGTGILFLIWLTAALKNWLL